jgi:alpha-beta hydrolase superfamily lysophospholipase
MAMNCDFREITFPSTDGVHNIYAELYLPRGEVRGIIQLVHGMIDHVGRYRELAEYMTERGFIFAGNHHLGHGKSVNSPEEYGYFADKGGVNFLLRDLHRLNRLLRDEYPGIPIVLLGHSMGSFLARLYVERYPHSIKAAIIHGTAGPNPMLPLGRALAYTVKKTHKRYHRSALVNRLAFGAYNSAFPVEDGARAWLSRDKAQADEVDEYVSFVFTAAGYSDLFKMLAKCNSRDWFVNYPKEIPTLIVSGTADPVGGKYASGPKYVYSRLKKNGVPNLELKLYDGARHELFRETNREEVFSDLYSWISRSL